MSATDFRTAALMQILALLRQHVGRENLISSRQIAAELRLTQSDRFVRDLLSDALMDGTLEELEIPLCAIPGKGYFLAADIEEASNYSGLIRSLAFEASRKLAALKRLYSALGLKTP